MTARSGGKIDIHFYQEVSLTQNQTTAYEIPEKNPIADSRESITQAIIGAAT